MGLIFLVDDDAALTLSMKRVLEAEGHEVVTSDNGRTAPSCTMRPHAAQSTWACQPGGVSKRSVMAGTRGVRKGWTKRRTTATPPG